MKQLQYAILKGTKVEPVTDVLKWAKWMGTNNRHVAVDKIKKVHVSTIFLGVNHAWSSGELWFETMIFGGEHDEYQKRYKTWEQAMAGHKRAIEMVKETLNSPHRG